MKLHDVSIRTKVFGALLTLFLFAVAPAVGTWLFLQQQQDDAEIVNRAGRQRMRIQTMVALSFQIAAGREEARSELLDVITQYERTLRLLREGDENGEDPPAPARVQSQLRSIQSQWDPFRARLQTIAQAERDSDSFVAALASVRSNSEALLDEADRVVQQYEAAYEQKVDTLELFLIGGIGLLVGTVGLLLVFVSRHVFRPLDRLKREAEAIADGRVDQEVTVLNTQDEVGALTQSIRQMKIWLVQALKETRTFKTAIENAGHSIYWTDREGIIEYVNPAFEVLTGYDREEVVGATPRILQSGEMDDAFYAELWDTITAGKVWHGEIVNARKGGEKYVVEQTIAPVHDGRAGIEHFIAVNIDITERRRREHQIERLRQRYESLLQGAPDAIFIADANTGEIVEANTSATSLLERPLEEIVEMYQWELHPSDREAQYRALFERHQRLAERDETKTLRRLEDGSQIHVVTASGEKVPVEISATFVDFDHRNYFVGSFRDVTERKRIEAELLQTKKMETVGTLAGGIAHDFNNILHAVTNYVALSRAELPVDHEVSTFLSRAEEDLKRAADLVGKLLTFARPESTRAYKHVRLGVLVEEVLDLAASSLPAEVELRRDVDPACTVMGDPDQLRHLIMGLVTNAEEALKSGDSDSSKVFEVRLQPVTVDAYMAEQYLNLDPGRYAHLSVSDTGPGMSQDTKEQIFDPFFTTKEPGQGIGLGLSVVHGAVQAHDGEITVRTEAGEGTTFNVYVPLVSEEASDDAGSVDGSMGAKEAKKGRVLVVDDDEDVLEMESLRLPRVGYEAVICTSGREALQEMEANSHRYDAVLSDYSMPEMDGLQLARALRERGHEVPIVLITGFSARISETEARAAGVDAFLQKPVDRQELETTLDRLFRSSH